MGEEREDGRSHGKGRGVSKGRLGGGRGEENEPPPS